MVAKMVLWYIVEGEKTEDELDEFSRLAESCNIVDYAKWVFGAIFGTLACYIAIVIYFLSWLVFPLAVGICL